MIKKQIIIVVLKQTNFGFLIFDTSLLQASVSYAKFLKAYHCEGEKNHFPYKHIVSLEILDKEALPLHSAFYSSLKKSSISEEEYEFVKKVWMEENCKSIQDMPICCNICDYCDFNIVFH